MEKLVGTHRNCMRQTKCITRGRYMLYTTVLRFIFESEAA